MMSLKMAAERYEQRQAFAQHRSHEPHKQSSQALSLALGLLWYTIADGTTACVSLHR